MKKVWSIPILAALCTGLGLTSGFFAAVQGGWSGGAAADPGHDAADAGAGGHAHLDKATLKTLGVTLGKCRTTTFVREDRIAAVMQAMPLAERPIHAPIGGRVRSISVRPGAVVGGGQPFLSILREPVPLPELILTSEAAQPAHEEIHSALRALRTAAKNREITTKELARINEWISEEHAVVPKQRRIDLEYELERAIVAYQLATHELERHGFTEAAIESLADGEHLPIFEADNVLRTLRHNGLWPETAQRLTDTLPPAVRALPLAIATIGELAGNGMITTDLLSWFESDESAAADILLVGSLLLRGRSLAEVRSLHEAGAIEPEFDARTPPSAPDWDVVDISVRPGADVRSGDQLGVVRDSRTMRMRINPVGGEVAILLAAIRERMVCRAVPLIPGTGDEVVDVIVRYATDAPDDVGTVAYADIENTPMTNGDGEGPRTWSLRPDVRYELRVPSTVLANAIVLPKSAVAREGAQRIVLRPKTAESFDEIPLAVAYEDDEVVVVMAEDNPEIADRFVVMTGAFALSLAMHADAGGGGHSHPHPH